MKNKIANGTVYKVDKSIPIPRKVADRTRFPFDKMEVGDSFLIPKEDQIASKARISLYTAVKTFNYHHNTHIKVTSREENNGLRVWRKE